MGFRLYYFGEYGNYGGPGYGPVYVGVNEEGEYYYTTGVAPKDGLDSIFMNHDISYSLTDLKLKNGDITKTEAALEIIEADAQLLVDSLSYKPYNDPKVVGPIDAAHAAAYQAAAIVAFTGKMLYDMDKLVTAGATDAITAAGNIINDLIASGVDFTGGMLGSALDDILNRLRDLFGNAENTKSPIIIDLNNDGIMTTNLKAGVYFDHDGNGLKNGTGWIKLDDGFLVMDRNGNGIIDSGRELFGDSTLLYTGGTAADGFAALAQEDANAGGVVNHPDANWHNLKLLGDEKLLAA